MYALAKKGNLFWKITREFSGMTDWMERVEKPEAIKYTPEMIKKMKCHKNSLYYNADWTIELWNCCYHATFKVIA